MNPLVVNYTLRIATTRLSNFNLRTIAAATANFFSSWAPWAVRKSVLGHSDSEEKGYFTMFSNELGQQC